MNAKILTCPFCGTVLIGKLGSRICENLGCGSYEVNNDNYNLSKNKRMDLKKVKQNGTSV